MVNINREWGKRGENKMLNSQLFSAIGLSANILGSIILTWDVARFFKVVKLTLDAHQIYIDSYMSNGGIYVIKGTNKHLEKQSWRSNYLTVVGIVLIILGFSLQLVGILSI